MTSDAVYIGNAGLEFFGKVSASISHDIKNVLAVINENAGLLEDFCLMAEKGKPLDPSRLKRLALDVKEQVRRGDGIVLRDTIRAVPQGLAAFNQRRKLERVFNKHVRTLKLVYFLGETALRPFRSFNLT